MAGFAGILGHAAAGFEQARQQDLARSFADEQNRRAMAGELLGKIIMDPNQPQEVRTTGLQTYLELAQYPPNKTYDFSKAIRPTFDLMAKYRAAGQQGQPQIAPPPAPPGLTTDQAAGARGQLDQATAAAQPTVTPPNAFPGASMLPQGPPPPPPPAGQPGMAPTPQANAGATMAAASPAGGGPPAPPQGAGQEFLAGPETIARNAAMMSGAQAGGQLTGQIAARQEYLNSIPGLSPELKGMMGLGMSPYMMLRGLPTGGGYAGAMRAQGYDIDPRIPDNQWVDIKGTPSMSMAVPGKAPGEVASGQGTLISPAQVYQQKLQAEMPYFTKKLGMRFANSIALQNNAFALAVQRGYLGDADKIFSKAQDDYGKRLSAMALMQQNYQEALGGNQQAQVSMLMQHIGMTAGTVPGAHQSRANIEEAEQSTPWISHYVNKWFHQDATGDYIFDGPKGGINLTKPQMEQMLSLAKERVQVQHEQLGYWQRELVPGQGEFTAPGIQAVHGVPQPTPGGGRGKPSARPPAPPSGGGTVKMRAPNGMEKEVPADQVEHYKSKGATVVQ